MGLPGKDCSVWMDTSEGQRYPALDRPLTVDVAVVGGGITGLTAALLLKRAGRRVAVLELNRVARGESGRTTAHLTEVLDYRFQTLNSHFGVEGAHLAAESSRASINFIERLAQDLRIDCGFQRLPAYLYTEAERDVSELEKELDAAREAGVDAKRVRDLPLPFPVRAAIRFDGQAQLHILRYLDPIAAAIDGDGSFVFENTRVTEIEDGEPCRLLTEQGHEIMCGEVFVAANTPINNRYFLHTKLAAYRTYAITVRVRDPERYQGLFWDTDEPYHYTRRFLPDSDLLIVGGEDHKVGLEERTDECYRRLEDYARTRFSVVSVEHRWSGQILNPVDGLPYIGLNPMSRHSYVAAGYSGNGITLGTVAGMLVSDLILGRENPWAGLYDATRIKPLASAREYIAENLTTPYRLVRDRLAPPDVEDTAQIPAGEGRIFLQQGEKLAVYRGEDGVLHAMSPVCPHLKCHVHWNVAEKSWDCPCHGSRFTATGQVINGPATADLEKREIAV